MPADSRVRWASSKARSGRGSRSNCQKMYGKGCSRHTLTVYFSLLAGHKVLLVIYYVALYLSMRATSSLPRGIFVP